MMKSGARRNKTRECEDVCRSQLAGGDRAPDMHVKKSWMGACRSTNDVDGNYLAVKYLSLAASTVNCPCASLSRVVAFLTVP
jgi:hypothetical protein